MGSGEFTLDERRRLAGETATDAEGGCPADEALAAFVEHALPPADRRHLEGHLDRCEACRAAIGHVVSTAPPAAARTIDRYRLDAPLGAGGMGAVYQAWDPALERAIAIKLLHPELQDAQGRARALREARALARLQHPNVIAIHDVGEHDGDVFIAMELVDGEPLDRWQRGRAPREVIAAYVQAARGLAAAHVLGLVHRDVKPNNILVARDGRVRIGDFGLASSAAMTTLERAGAGGPRTSQARLTEHGTRLGTPAYMAPEQHLSPDVDARADQFSLCAALAEGLLGEVPAPGTTAAMLAARGGDVPGPWAAIARGLAAGPEARFPDVTSLVAALEAPPVRGRRWRTPVALVVGATGLALAGTAAWQLAAAPPASGHAAGPPGGAAPTGSVATTPPWFWVLRPAPAWRLPSSADAVALVDATHAVVAAVDTLSLVDLDTGEVAAPIAVSPSGRTGPGGAAAPGDPRIDALLPLGARLLAIGHDADRLVAWEVSHRPGAAAPLGVTPLRVPADERAEAAAVGTLPEPPLVAPDGAHVLLCPRDRWPTIRDSATLAVRQRATGLHCDASSGFVSATIVELAAPEGRRLLDVTTGAVTPLAVDAPRRLAGPGGRTFVLDETAGTYAISAGATDAPVQGGTTAGGAAPVRRGTALAGHHAWARGGGHVLALGDRTLGIYPLDDQARDRTIELPGDARLVDADARTAVVVADGVVLAIDLASGAVRGPQGSRALIVDVAPRGRGVVVASDRMRVLRDGALVATGEPARAFAVGDATAPVDVVERTSVIAWTPETGERQPVRILEQIDEAYPVIERTGDVLAFVDGDRVYRGQGRGPGAAPPTLWFRAGAQVMVGALAPGAARVVITEQATSSVVLDRKRGTREESSFTPRAHHVVDPASRRAWAFAEPRDADGDCPWPDHPVALWPDGARVAIGTPRGVAVRDVATGTWLGVFELPGRTGAWAPLADGRLVMAAAGEVIVWDVALRTARAWPAPVAGDPIRIGVAPAGGVVAVGYLDGSVLWVDLDDPRAALAPRTLAVHAATPCEGVAGAPLALDALLAP